MGFSKSYIECREKFIEAAGNINAACASEYLPGYIENNSKLSIDIASLGDVNAKKALIILSGVHGIEGYCGSEIQTSFLELYKTKTRIPEDISVYLIHSVNPYGFYHGRRTNEDNIDLNRNFRVEEDFAKKNEGYRKIHPYLCPDDWSLETRNKTRLALDKLESDMPTEYMRAVASGQSEFDDGLFYAGIELSWSVRKLQSWKIINLKNKQHICAIDIHSGLGKYAIGQLQT